MPWEKLTMQLIYYLQSTHFHFFTLCFLPINIPHSYSSAFLWGWGGAVNLCSETPSLLSLQIFVSSYPLLIPQSLVYLTFTAYSAQPSPTHTSPFWCHALYITLFTPLQSLSISITRFLLSEVIPLTFTSSLFRLLVSCFCNTLAECSISHHPFLSLSSLFYPSQPLTFYIVIHFYLFSFPSSLFSYLHCILFNLHYLLCLLFESVLLFHPLVQLLSVSVHLHLLALSLLCYLHPAIWQSNGSAAKTDTLQGLNICLPFSLPCSLILLYWVPNSAHFQKCIAGL